ncbi:MAG: hypothetical protein JG782_1250 [Anaerophaga sp.]|nr:hypothetical protein [Anaerophaga sp.]MDK2841724.1 hypothetical protein [Anaerophaga sp.]MDN5290199.1 hypothetical protein [Anaerophaga sp.]
MSFKDKKPAPFARIIFIKLIRFILKLTINQPKQVNDLLPDVNFIIEPDLKSLYRFIGELT